jgi:hypothetical protein
MKNKNVLDDDKALKLTLRVEEPLKNKVKDYPPMTLKEFKSKLKRKMTSFYKLKSGGVIHLDNKKMVYALGEAKPTLDVLTKAREAKIPTYQYVVIQPSGVQQEIYGWSMRELDEEYGLMEKAILEIKQDKLKVIKMERANSKHKWPMGTILYDKRDKPSSLVLLEALKEVSRGNLGNTKPFTLVVEHTNGEKEEVNFSGPSPNEDGHKWGINLNSLASIKKGNVYIVKGANKKNLPLGTMIYSLNTPPSKESLDKAKQESVYLECYINQEETKRVFYDRRKALELFSPLGLEQLRREGYLLTKRVKSIKGYPIGTIAHLANCNRESIATLLEEEELFKNKKKRVSTKQGATIRIESCDGSYKDHSHTHRGQLLRELGIWALQCKGDILLDKYGKRDKISKYDLVYSIDAKRAPSDSQLQEARDRRDAYIKDKGRWLTKKLKRVVVKVRHLDGMEEVKELEVSNRLYYMLKKDDVYEVRNYSKNLQYTRGTKLFLK